MLEYRVWCHPVEGGEDHHHAFGSYLEAEAFAERTPGAESPLALILQREFIDAPPDRLEILRGNARRG